MSNAIMEGGREALENHCSKITEILRATTPNKTGVSSGRLASSIKFRGPQEVGNSLVGVVEMLKYGKVLEFGSPVGVRNIVPNQWITRAIQAAEPELQQDWERILGEHMKRAGKVSYKKTITVVK